MKYQLPNGRIIEISLEDYLESTDENFDAFIKEHSGVDIDTNFFYSSSDNNIKKSRKENLQMEFDEDADNYETNEPLNLDNIPDENADSFDNLYIDDLDLDDNL